VAKAAVIGSGFGGLALAIRLQSGGIETTILEARDRAGGRAYAWERDGFIFDAGPTVITDPDCLDELWALSGRSLSDDLTLATYQLAALAPIGTIDTHRVLCASGPIERLRILDQVLDDVEAGLRFRLQGDARQMPRRRRNRRSLPAPVSRSQRLALMGKGCPPQRCRRSSALN